MKRWLAQVGYERVQEIEDPELATKRTRALYKAKSYPDDWIEKRMRGIAIREELTDEWQKRGARWQRDYEVLTAEISKATFNITPSEYKRLKLAIYERVSGVEPPSLPWEGSIKPFNYTRFHHNQTLRHFGLSWNCQDIVFMNDVGIG